MLIKSLLYISFGLLCQVSLFDSVTHFSFSEIPDLVCLSSSAQAMKMASFKSATSAEHALMVLKTWAAFDVAYCLTLSQLRLPGLNYGPMNIIFLFWALDGAMYLSTRPETSFEENLSIKFPAISCSFLLLRSDRSIA